MESVLRIALSNAALATVAAIAGVGRGKACAAAGADACVVADRAAEAGDAAALDRAGAMCLRSRRKSSGQPVPCMPIAPDGGT